MVEVRYSKNTECVFSMVASLEKDWEIRRQTGKYFRNGFTEH
jgi:hypothetical protein